MKVALNDSARALSAELPTALIDCRTPAAAHAEAKALDVYWAPWSEWNSAPARLPRVRSAAFSASMTSSVRMWSAIAQPASLREYRSMTVAR